jgi:hypothetical protein
MMKANEIKVKMDAAYEKWQKRIAITKKNEEKAEKALATIKANGWDKYADENGRYNYYRIRWEEHDEKAANVCDKYEEALRNARESRKKEPEVEAVYNGWVEKYNKALIAEEENENLPEIFKEAIKAIADRWTEYDRIDLDEMNAKLAEMKKYNPNSRDKADREKYDELYRAFHKRFPWQKEDYLRSGEENWMKVNTDEATYFIKDLIRRLRNKVGEVTDLGELTLCGTALNGRVTGTKGTTYVETILAGGYNVQRLHNRVILH